MRFARHRTVYGPRLAVLDDAEMLVDLDEDAELATLLADGRLAAAAETALRTLDDRIVAGPKPQDIRPWGQP